MREHTAIKVIIALVAAVFLIHQAYSSFYKPITTMSAEYYEAVDGLTVTATVIRNEKLVTCDAEGALHFSVADGERAPKGGIIAQVYDNASASITVSRIAQLERQISDIEQMQSYNDVQAADLDLINDKVDDAINGFVQSCSADNFSDAAQASAELVTAINRRQLITGEQADFSSQLSSLKAELESAKASLPAAKANVTAAVSGYFVSSTDGFEQVLACDALDSITPEYLDGLKSSDVPSNTIGKIVSDYEWYIAARVTIDQSLKYKEGDALTVKTGIKSAPTLSVNVKQVNMSSGGNDAVVLFSCSEMNSALATLRQGTMTVVSNTYDGLRIEKKALRVVDGKTGVYVLSGMALKFVPVEVVYSPSDNEYIICKQEKSNENVLRLYDEVVVKGKKLYDGKIVG